MRRWLIGALLPLAFCGTADAATKLTLKRATQVAHRYVSRDVRSGAATNALVTTCNRGADNRGHNQRQATCFIEETGGWQVLTNWPIIVSLSHNGRFIDVRSGGPLTLSTLRERV